MPILNRAQIKVVSHKYFSGIMDKNNTVKPMVLSEAREVLRMMGYKKIREENENGCFVEIWELPPDKQTR